MIKSQILNYLGRKSESVVLFCEKEFMVLKKKQKAYEPTIRLREEPIDQVEELN